MSTDEKRSAELSPKDSKPSFGEYVRVREEFGVWFNDAHDGFRAILRQRDVTAAGRDWCTFDPNLNHRAESTLAELAGHDVCIWTLSAHGSAEGDPSNRAPDRLRLARG